MISGDGRVEGMENVGCREIQVGMDVGGVVLDKGFVGMECREMRGKGTTSTVTCAEVVFKVGDK